MQSGPSQGGPRDGFLDDRMDAIELKGLSKSFPKTGRVVDKLDLRVKQGEFITLLGPSGCGKTTTLRLIAGFEYPNEGSVHVSGIDVTDLPPYRRPVNTVFQDYALFPHMNVEQNVGYGLWIERMPRGEIRERVAGTLQSVGLADKARARPSELSGGQKQRVALARAIVRRPQVLLLDEPLSALDAKLREAMQVELRHLHQQLGITFMLVTHDQTEAMVMSDRILIMEGGKVVQDGTPGELYDTPVSPYVANFIGTSNLLPARVVETSGDELLAEVGGTKLRVRTRGRRFSMAAPITLAIRPEKCEAIAIDLGKSPEPTTIAGTIVEHLYHGDKLRTRVDIGLDTPFLIDTQLGTSTSQGKLAAVGTACRIRIDEPSIIAFDGRTSP
jgi:spermidine/putrescine ABC transporter ATP-binding subunit